MSVLREEIRMLRQMLKILRRVNNQKQKTIVFLESEVVRLREKNEELKKEQLSPAQREFFQRYCDKLWETSIPQ
mgnify:CR=1 FL=1